MLSALWRRRHRYDVIHVAQLSALAGPAAVVGTLTRTPVVIGIQNAGPEPALLAQLERQERQERDIAHQQTPALESPTTRHTVVRPRLRGVLEHVDNVTSLRRNVLGGGFLVELLRRSRCRFQALSTRSRQRLIDYGFDASRMVIIPGSVDVERYRPRLVDSAPMPARSGTVLCAARLEYNKGIDVLLQAWAALSRKRDVRDPSRPRLLLAGDGSMRGAYEELARTLGIASDVSISGRARRCARPAG